MDRLDATHFTTVGKSMAVGTSPNLGRYTGTVIVSAPT